MNAMVRMVAVLALVLGAGCSKNDLSNYSLGAETYPNIPDCKQVYFNGKPVGVYLKKLNKADGARVEGVACHGVNIVVDAKAGSWKEGSL